MSSRRDALLALGASALVASLSTFAQPKPARVHRIGILVAGLRPTSAAGRLIEVLRASLRDLGYVEGKNLVIEERYAEGKYDLMPQLAAELVGLNVDVIVASGTPATMAAKKATSTIPIVMQGVGDAAGTGIITSLARPGGNVTGMTIYSPELFAKRLELMKEALPHIQRVAVLLNPANPAQERSWQAIQKVAGSLKVELQKFEPRGPQEYAAVFASMAKQRVDALIIPVDTMFNVNARAIADLAVKHQLPAIGPEAFSAAGALMSYGVLNAEQYRRTAYFVDRILKGAKPSDLPVELPTRFELTVNLKTAKTLGVTLTNSILARADKVIE